MPRCLRTRLSWTTSSGFGWLVPSILRLRLLHGRHRILEPVVLEKGPRTPGAVGIGVKKKLNQDQKKIKSGSKKN